MPPTSCLLSGETMIGNTYLNSKVLLTLGIVAAIVLLVTQGPSRQFWKDRLQTLTSSTDNKQSKISETMKRDERPGNIEKNDPALPANDPVALNAAGVSLVLKKKLWEGMYYFDRAIRLDPSRIIPIINMAAVLTELGLSRPAARYLAMAEALDPEYPWLPRNLTGAGPVHKSTPDADTDIVYEPRVLTPGQVKKSGSSLWEGEVLSIWGINGKEAYER